MTTIGTFCRADRLRLATLFQSTEADRLYLNGVSIQPLPNGGVRLVATDGHRMAIFHDAAGYTCAPCIVDLPKPARDAIKAIKQREFVWFGIVGQHAASGRYEARIVDGERLASMEDIQAAMLDITRRDVIWAGAVDLIDGTFPSIKNAIPDGINNVAPASLFQGRYMAAFVAVAEDAGQKGAWLAIHQNDSEPALVHCARPDFVGVLMPMQSSANGGLELDGTMWRTPAWAKACEEGEA